MTTTTKTPAPSTRNVTRVFRAATPEQIKAGMEWYEDAHAIAAALATQYNVTIETAAGVIAALSPMNSWGNNINLAVRFLDHGGLDSGYLKLGLGKAQAILDGAEPESVLTSDKIAAFYECILHAGQTDAVCIDRHAYDIAINVRNTDAGRPTIRGKRYDTVAETYRRAGKILGLRACMVQSTTWTVWRHRFWAPGAFDGNVLA